MRVAGFMSGSGTNLVKILERQDELGRDDDDDEQVQRADHQRHTQCTGYQQHEELRPAGHRRCPHP